MLRLLIRNWWLLLMRGIFAVTFAIFIFVFLPLVPAPLLRELAFAGLTVIFGVFAAVTGLLTLVAAVRGASQGGSSWLLLADGIVVTTAGLALLLSPQLTLAHVIQIIATTALAAGVLEIVAGVHLRRHVKDEWLLVSGGAISAILAVALFFFMQRTDAQLVLRWVLSYAVASGLAMLGIALRLRNLRQSVNALAESHMAATAQGQKSGT